MDRSNRIPVFDFQLFSFFLHIILHMPWIHSRREVKVCAIIPVYNHVKIMKTNRRCIIPVNNRSPFFDRKLFVPTLSTAIQNMYKLPMLYNLVLLKYTKLFRLKRVELTLELASRWHLHSQMKIELTFYLWKCCWKLKFPIHNTFYFSNHWSSQVWACVCRDLCVIAGSVCAVRESDVLHFMTLIMFQTRQDRTGIFNEHPPVSEVTRIL